MPVVVRRQVLGSPWCASATDHGLRGGDSACACPRGADRGVPMPQIMEVFVVQAITEDIMEVIQLGIASLTCPLCATTDARMVRRQKTAGSAVAIRWNVVDACYAGAQRCRRWSSCGYGRPFDLAATWGLANSEVPQIQFIAPFEDIPVVQQRRV